MNIYHLFTVHAVNVASYEIPRVKLREFYLRAASVRQAFHHIHDWAGVVDALEVWGAKVPRRSEGAECIVSHHTKLESESGLGEYENWERNNQIYSLLHRGECTPREWFERRWEEHIRETCPSLYRESEFGAGANP